LPNDLNLQGFNKILIYLNYMRHQPIDTKFTHEEVEKEIRYLQLLSKQFRSGQD
jgi:hypothetical protein